MAAFTVQEALPFGAKRNRAVRVDRGDLLRLHIKDNSIGIELHQSDMHLTTTTQDAKFVNVIRAQDWMHPRRELIDDDEAPSLRSCIATLTHL